MNNTSQSKTLYLLIGSAAVAVAGSAAYYFVKNKVEDTNS